MVGILGWVAMSVALPYQTALGELSSGCLSPGFLSVVGPLEPAGSQKYSSEGLVNGQSPALFTHRVSLWVRNELFFWWDCQFELASCFSKALQWLTFPTRAAELFHLHMGFFSVSCSALSSPSRQRGNIPSMYLATSFVQREHNQLPHCARIWGSLPNSVLCSPCGLPDLLGWKGISYRATQAGNRQRSFVSTCVWQSWSSQMLAAALCIVRVSPLCYSWWGWRQSKVERDLCRQVAVGGFVSACIMVGPGTPSCFQVFAILCSLCCVSALLTQAGN
jgi:hypothetical protein